MSKARRWNFKPWKERHNGEASDTHPRQLWDRGQTTMITLCLLWVFCCKYRSYQNDNSLKATTKSATLEDHERIHWRACLSLCDPLIDWFNKNDTRRRWHPKFGVFIIHINKGWYRSRRRWKSPLQIVDRWIGGVAKIIDYRLYNYQAAGWEWSISGGWGIAKIIDYRLNNYQAAWWECSISGGWEFLGWPALLWDFHNWLLESGSHLLWRSDTILRWIWWRLRPCLVARISGNELVMSWMNLDLAQVQIHPAYSIPFPLIS